ncbi:MAG: sensor histidine kinase [Acidimicrobiia bacterium]
MRLVLGAVALVLVGLAIFEFSMQPSGAERAELALIFIVMATITGLAALFLPMMAGRNKRLVATLFTLALVSVGIAVVGLVIAASRMFFSEHDLALLLVVLGFGLLAALGFAASASRSLTGDLKDMARTAHDVAAGDFSARTSVDRRDEVGDLARDLDAMAEKLEASAAETDLENTRRRAFFAAVSHDLRTPLSSMQAAVEALRDGVAPDPDRYFQSLESDLSALNSLVDDLFLLSRLESGDVFVDVAPTDLSDVADEALEVLRPVAHRKDLHLELVAERRVVLQTGSDAVGRVIRNLLENAIRHAPAASTVQVTVDGGDPAVVTVHDEGEGFPPDFIDKAFDSFTRTDEARTRAAGGAGLGLAIAKGYVDALDGSIWAEPGPGGTVAFSIPSGAAS